MICNLCILWMILKRLTVSLTHTHVTLCQTARKTNHRPPQNRSEAYVSEVRSQGSPNTDTRSCLSATAGCVCHGVSLEQHSNSSIQHECARTHLQPLSVAAATHSCRAVKRRFTTEKRTLAIWCIRRSLHARMQWPLVEMSVTCI